MRITTRLGMILISIACSIGVAQAGKDADTTTLFRNAGQSARYFDSSYGYALFPTIGKAGLGIGGARGSGHVYVHGKRIGRTTVTQLSVGFQAGGEAYSQIIFFANKDSLDDFTKGNFEFSADVGAIAITAAASASAGTNGADAGVSKGGLMYEASLAGQKYSYEPSTSN